MTAVDEWLLDPDGGPRVRFARLGYVELDLAAIDARGARDWGARLSVWVELAESRYRAATTTTNRRTKHDLGGHKSVA